MELTNELKSKFFALYGEYGDPNGDDLTKFDENGGPSKTKMNLLLRKNK